MYPVNKQGFRLLFKATGLSAVIIQKLFKTRARDIQLHWATCLMMNTDDTVCIFMGFV